MCLELEKIGRKSFQFFPLQTNAIPRHIQIDTKALIELFVSNEKKQYLDNIELHKEILWSKHFNIQVKLKNYIFDHTIITDGYAVSLRFIHKDCLEEEQTKKARMKKGKQALKGLTEEQTNLIQEKKAEDLKKKKEEGKKKRLEAKEKPNLVKKIVEFPYVDEVEKIELQGKHIFIDPGKRTLLSMMDDDGNFFSYTNSQRISDTKRFKYQNVLKKYIIEHVQCNNCLCLNTTIKKDLGRIHVITCKFCRSTKNIII
jgi:translation initiation factor 2 beta subunit (eIF-2beta)/eIF-5